MITLEKYHLKLNRDDQKWTFESTDDSDWSDFTDDQLFYIEWTKGIYKAAVQYWNHETEFESIKEVIQDVKDHTSLPPRTLVKSANKT